MEIAKGDKVQSKVGGPVMLVQFPYPQQPAPNGNMWNCIWWNPTTNTFCSFNHYEHTLELVEKGQP